MDANELKNIVTLPRESSKNYCDDWMKWFDQDTS